MEHGIVPRRCPTAYCAPSQHGKPVNASDAQLLREHDAALNAKVIDFGERMRKVQIKRWRN